MVSCSSWKQEVGHWLLEVEEVLGEMEKSSITDRHVGTRRMCSMDWRAT